MRKYDDKQWNKQYEQLVDFKRNNGHCMVTFKYEQDKSLGLWVHTQRKRHANNIMRQDRKELLDEIGFAWKTQAANNDKKWRTQYEKLVDFKRKNGNCLVPYKYDEDATLGMWVSRQRHFHVNNTARPDRKGLLEKLGFAWKASGVAKNDKNWYQQYEKLVEFKRKNGNCLVPQKYQEDVSLGMWVYMQRHYHTNNSILQDRKDLLDELGFAWKPPGGGNKDKNWHQQYEKLVEFKRKNGHCLVPQGYEKDVSLGVWVRTQRHYHTNNSILQDRIDLLDELGFAWKTPRGGSTVSCISSVEKDGGRDEEQDSKPSPVTSSALILASYPDEEVVQEEATDDESDDELPSGWTRLKLEPDC
jgi:uncharacterized protein YbgA (DUF1722 family)